MAGKLFEIFGSSRRRLSRRRLGRRSAAGNGQERQGTRAEQRDDAGTARHLTPPLCMEDRAMSAMLTHNDSEKTRKPEGKTLDLRPWTLADLRPSTFDLAIGTAKDAKVEGPRSND